MDRGAWQTSIHGVLKLNTTEYKQIYLLTILQMWSYQVFVFLLFSIPTGNFGVFRYYLACGDTPQVYAYV